MKLTTILSTTALIALAGAAAADDLHLINCGDGDQPMSKLEAEHIAAWEARTGHSVTVEFIPWGQCQEKATTLAASGNPVSAAYMGSRVLKQLATNDMILPIPMSEEELGTYAEAVISTSQFDGETWGLPRAFSTKALYWNPALFEAAGLDMPNGPETFGQMLEAAKAITENTDARGYGMAAADFDNTMHQFLNWLYSNGGEVIDADGNIVFNSENNVETLRFYQELAKYSQEGPLAYDRAKLEPLFAEEQVAMYISGGWGRNRAGDLDFRIAPIPAGPMGEHSTLLITDSLVVFKGTGVEEAATDLVKYLTAPEQQAPFDKAGGWTPIRQDAFSDALIEEDASWAPFIEAVPTGGPEPLMEDYVAMQDAINEGIQGVILDELSPEEAAERIQEDLEDLQ